METTSRVWPERFGLLLALAFAFALAMHSGMRGLFPLDQSIVFDGGYRVSCGQVPYRDFRIPYGPIAFWIQGGLFRLCGVNWYSYVLGAALLNAGGAACAYSIVRTLSRGSPVASLAAAALTAAWLYAPFGTTYPEQTAFCAILGSLSLVLAAAPRIEPSGFAKSTLGSACAMTLAGLVAVVAVLSKHNAGLPALGIFFVAAMAANWPDWRRGLRGLVCFAVGFSLGALAFGIWLRTCSDWWAFIEQTIETPRHLGVERIFNGGWTAIVEKLLTGKGNDAIRILLVAWGLLSCATAAICLRERNSGTNRGRQMLVAGTIGLAVLTWQNVFSAVSANDGANERPFLGILFAIALINVRFLAERAARIASSGATDDSSIPRWWAAALCVLASGLSLWLRNGVVVAGTAFAAVVAAGLGAIRLRQTGAVAAMLRWTLAPRVLAVATSLVFVGLLGSGAVVSELRRVHESFVRNKDNRELFAGARYPAFDKSIAASGLSGLRWGEPTVIGAQAVSAADLDALVAHLRGRPDGFFVFPDCTFLYAALDVPSPQPMLWFHKGLTYPATYDDQLDGRIVAALRRNQVQTVVLEADSFFGTQARLDDFPKLGEFIAKDFEAAARIGPFLVRHRRYPQELRGGGLVAD